MTPENHKRASKVNYLGLLTKIYGFCVWVLSSMAITYHLLHSTLTLPYCLFYFVGFMAGRYIQKTAYQE